MEAVRRQRRRNSNQHQIDPSVYRQARMIFAFSALYGTTPVLYVDGKFKLSYGLLAYSTVILFAFIYAGYLTYLTVVICADNRVVELILLWLTPMYSAMYFVSLYKCCKNIECINNILISLRLIDKVLDEISITKRRPRGWLDRHFEIILLAIYGFTVSCFVSSWLPFAFFSVGTTAFGFLCAHFLLVGRYISNIFQSAVECLYNVASKDRRSKEESTIKLSRIHNKLCHLLDEFYFCYSAQFLIATLFVVMYSITRSYYLWCLNDFGQLDFCLRTYWIFFYWVNFLRVICCSQNITNKCQRFHLALYQQMIYNTDDILDSEYIKLHIAMKEEVAFTAYGFFNLDYTLINSMVSVIATYIVILIQFDF